MGIIIKQSIKGSIWSYLGVGIGFVTTAYLFPEYLTTDVIGLFGLLIAWSNLFAQFSALGFHGVTSRLFPYFRDKKKGHNGFLFIALMVIIIGFLLFLIAFFFLKPILVDSNLEKSKLFADYIDLLIPLTFFTLIFSMLDVFNKLLYNAVLGTFLTELLQRILIFTVVVAFIFQWLTLHQLILAYAVAVSAKGVFIFIYLLGKGELNFKPKLNFIDKKLKKEMIDVAIFSILAGVGGNIVFRIDKIIVNQMLGLSATGVYTIAFFFGTLVVIPSRTLLKISGTLIADAWKRNDMEYINNIYKRSCINQFIIAAFLFGGIWINIDNILTILGPEYAEGKWVIFFIGIGYVIDMATGANGHIIAYSRYYRIALWLLLSLAAIVMGLMFLFIPTWGISGAASAIAAAFLINNFNKFLYVKIKFGMQPFTSKFFIVVLIFGCSWGLSVLIHQLNLILDILFRSAVFTVSFLLLIHFLRISEDLENLVNRILGKGKKNT